MTQFMICRQRPQVAIPEGVVVRAIVDADDPAKQVAEHYFDTGVAPQVVVDGSGSAAPLVDTVWEKLSELGELSDCPLVQLFAILMREKIGFVLWCSCDFEELPLVRNWDELMAELRKQAAMQPADVYLRYHPSD